MLSSEDLNIEIESSVNCAVVGDIVEYKIIATNTGEDELKDVIIYSELDENLKFLKGTVKINNIPFKDANITSGIEIGDLETNEKKILIFKAEVLEDEEIKVSITAKFKTISKENQKVVYMEAKSNLVTFGVDRANLYIEKTSDLKEVGLDDVVTYKVLIVNDGNLKAKNIVFSDLLDKSTKFIEDSLIVNGGKRNSADLKEGVIIGDLDLIESTEIEYKAKVINTNSTGNIINIARVKYQYTKSCGTTSEKSFEKTEVINAIKSRISSFKQITLETMLELPEEKPSIECINDVTGEAIIKECHLIETSKSKSQEGQNLTGYKLIVSGCIKISLNYTACETEQGVYLAQYEMYFTEFIVLSGDFIPGSKIKVEADIEDIYNKLCSDRKVFINPTILLNVKGGIYN